MIVPIRYLACAALVLVTMDGRAQSPVPVITKLGQFVVFDGGVFRQLEARAPQAIHQGGDRLAFMTDANDLKLYDHGEVKVLERGESVSMAVSKHLMAWKSGPALRVPSGSGASTICRRVGRYTVSDSVVVFHDLMQHQIGVQWGGRIFPIADVLMDDQVPWKAGSNTVLLYDLDRRRVLLFYRGLVTTLCNGTDPSRSTPGGDVVAFMDEYDDTFRVFDRGEEYELEPFAPSAYAVGEGLVAWVNATGAFRCFWDRRLWDLADFAPEEYWVRDSVIVFRDGNLFKVFSGGAVETLEQNMPAHWDAEGGMVAWIDGRGEMKVFHHGRTQVVSRDPGIKQFVMYPGVVTFRTGSGETKVWWRDKLYGHN